MGHKVSTLLYIIALAVITMGAASYSDPRTYDRYKGVSLQGRLRNDTLFFNIPCQWEGHYQLDLYLRTAQTYSYRNISIIIGQRTTHYKQRKKREKAYSDIINYEIISDKGMLVGQEGISDTEIRQAVTAFHLGRNDFTHVTIRHIMSRGSLPGISGVDIRLLKK